MYIYIYIYIYIYSFIKLSSCEARFPPFFGGGARAHFPNQRLVIEPVFLHLLVGSFKFSSRGWVSTDDVSNLLILQKWTSNCITWSFYLACMKHCRIINFRKWELGRINVTYFFRLLNDTRTHRWFRCLWAFRASCRFCLVKHNHECRFLKNGFQQRSTKTPVFRHNI